MKYKPIHVQIGSQGTLLSAPSRTCKQFSYLCLHFPSQEEVWKLFHCNVENPCLQMLKVLEKYLHQARSAGCVVTVDRRNERRNEKLAGIQLHGQHEMSDCGRRGKGGDEQETPVTNVISTQVTVMQKLHASKLLVGGIICYQTPTAYCWLAGKHWVYVVWSPFLQSGLLCFTAAYKSAHQVVLRYVTKCRFLGLKYFLEPKFITLE